MKKTCRRQQDRAPSRHLGGIIAPHMATATQGSIINRTSVSERVPDSPTETAASASHHLHSPPPRPPPTPPTLSRVQLQPNYSNASIGQIGQRNADIGEKKKSNFRKQPPITEHVLFFSKKHRDFPILPRDGDRCMRWNRVLIWEKMNMTRVIQRAFPTFIPSPKSSDR